MRHLLAIPIVLLVLWLVKDYQGDVIKLIVTLIVLVVAIDLLRPLLRPKH
jgi:hypothetical protein